MSTSPPADNRGMTNNSPPPRKPKTHPAVAVAAVVAALIAVVLLLAVAKGATDSYNRDADAVNAPTNTF